MALESPSSRVEPSIELGDAMRFAVEKLLEEPTLRESLRVPFGDLLDEGFGEAEVLGAFLLGPSTPEGVRAVLTGAPVEWARAFEDGAPVKELGGAR